jgi:dihydropyrimidine dehydrogenase (NAD+) subunit PreT
MAAAPTVDREVFEELRPPLAVEEAVVEADRCLRCGGPHAEAPCTVACPAGIDVARFVEQLADGDAGAAAATIFEANLLGASCARVCPVEVLCQGACVLPHDGWRPIEIGRLQRFASDYALAHGQPLRARAPATGRAVAVVGAGPAGLACAGELAARGHRVRVYDARAEVGGLVRYAIAPYRQQREPLPQEAAALAALGVEFELGVHVDEAILDELGADAVFLGIGMGGDPDAPYPGDDLPGVWDSLPFIEAVKSGRPPQVGRSVAVVGGGNTAVDVAREALMLGAQEVTLLYRRTEDEMPAYAHEVEEARSEGVRLQWLTVPLRFLGSDRLEAVECCYTRLGEPDASGRRRPEQVSGTEFVFPVDTVVKAIGQRAPDPLGVELERGRVQIDPETGRTSKPGWFAGGDAVNGGDTAVEAVAGGKRAALAIDAYLSGELQ